MNTHAHQAPSRTVSTPPRRRSARWRALVGLGVALALSLAALPAPASAASCGSLVQGLNAYLSSGVAGANVDMHHTTNYQAGFCATAHSAGSLSHATNGALLTTATPRSWDTGWTQYMYIDFYANGSVRFRDEYGTPYGPYAAQCYGDKFLIVNTGDSYETFTFEKNIFIIY